MAWDVRVPDTLAPSHVQASATRAGTVAEQSEALKTTKYAAIAVSHTFIPLAFETLGAWGKQAQQFVAELGRRITVVTGTRERLNSYGSASRSPFSAATRSHV